MRLFQLSAAVLVPLLLLDACAGEPMGPTIGVMPAPGKSFGVFQEDQAVCKQFASNEVAGGAQSSNNRQIGTAIVGTLLGAGLGAAIGGGRGAGIGAGAGALGGTAVGAGPAAGAGASLQDRYNLAYSQCMYTRGNQVPGYAPAPGYQPAPAYQTPPGYQPAPGSAPYPAPPPGYR